MRKYELEITKIKGIWYSYLFEDSDDHNQKKLIGKPITANSYLELQTLISDQVELVNTNQ